MSDQDGTGGLSTAPVEPVVAPALGPLGWARLLWRQLTSMRVALLLLFLLAVGSVPGSVLPQRPIDPAAVSTYLREHAELGPWLDRFQLFDVFGSVWFSAIYLLLFVSLVGCVLPRTLVHARAVRTGPPPAPRSLFRMPEHWYWDSRTGSAETLAAAGSVLAAARYRTAVGDGWVAAEKGYAREVGNLLFHLALLVILVGVAVGDAFGFTASKLLVEGDRFANTPTAYDTLQPGRLFDTAAMRPFTVELDRFDASYETTGRQVGQPRSFTASVRFQEQPGDRPRPAKVEVNHPLTVGSVDLFLTGNGYAPVFTVRDGTGQVAFNGPAPFLPQDGNNTSVGVVKAPDARPQGLAFTGFFLPTAVVDDKRGPHSVFPAPLDPAVFLNAWRGDDGSSLGTPQSVYQLDTKRMTQLRRGREPLRAALVKGQTLTLPDGLGSITFEGYRRYAYFHLASDPGQPVVLVGAVLAVAGLMLSLFVPRRRLWVRARTGADGLTRVELAGLTRVESESLAVEMGRVADRLHATAPPVPAETAEEQT